MIKKMNYGIMLTLAVIISGCSTGALSINMIPEDVTVTNRHAYSVLVKTSGGQETNPAFASKISNDNFQTAIIDSIKKYGLFSSILTDGVGDLRLDVEMQSLDQPSFGMDLTVSLATKWTLTNIRDNTVELSDVILSSCTATSGDSLIFVKRLQIANEMAAKKNIKEALTKISKAAPNANFVARLKEDKEFDAAVSTGKLISLETFLTSYPGSNRRSEAIAASLKILAIQNSSVKYKSFLNKFPDSYSLLPTKMRLSLCGPEGLRISDIVEMKKSMGEKLIATKIRMRSGKYLDFSSEDITDLKKMGLSEFLIQTLMESTEKAHVMDAENKKKQEIDDTISELKNVKRELAETKNAQKQVPESAKTGNSNGTCLQLTSALAACAYTPGGYFAKLACESAAKMAIKCD